MSLQTFQARLTPMGPVAIGSGEEITKKEYVLYPKDHRIVVMDMPELYVLAQKRHLEDSFEQFLCPPAGHRNDQDLYGWIRKNRINGKALQRCVRYMLPTGAIERSRNYNVGAFVKDPYGKPYVPGSSIKGMLRTLLLVERIIKDRRRFTGEIDRLKRACGKKAIQQAMAALEAKAFRTIGRPGTRREDAVNDVLSGLIVSDSVPLDAKDLILCQRVERKPDGKEKTLPILKESLRPGMPINFSLAIDSSRCALTKAALLEVVACFDKVYQDCFLSAFSGMDRLTGSEVYLGGSAGFATKTIIYAALGQQAGVQKIQKILQQSRAFRKHHHERDQKRFGVSPHIVKCTRYGGKLYEFGKCRLTIE
jgi:CRISPR-associated protein Csm5